MKMKKIAAILTALSVFSGCAGNTVTEEATTTTGTTEVVTTATTTEAEISETKETTTEKNEEQISKENSDFDSTKGPESAVTPPPLFSVDITKTEETKYPIITVTSEEITTNSAIVDEVVEHIQLVTVPYETGWSDFEALATVLSTTTFKVYGTELIFYFKFNDNPNESFVENWGFYPSAAKKRLDKSLYLDEIIIDLTSSSPEELYKYIDKGTSVMVWVTEGLAEPVLFAEYEGNKMYSPKECVVLAGYSDTAVCVWSVIEGKYVTYDRALFEQRYAEMGSMALTVVVE